MPQDDSYIVTLEGHEATITEQLRLLPFSQNILCLPPIELPPAPPVREALSPSEQLPPLDPAVRQFILALHYAHVNRLEHAKSFLADRREAGGEKMVFLNGGFAAAQTACLETLRNALMSEENGNAENAAREAEWVFEDIMRGGVQGLLDQEDRDRERESTYGTLEIGHLSSDEESVAEKMKRNGGGAPGESFERELYAEQLATPEYFPVPGRSWSDRSASPHQERTPAPEEVAAGTEISRVSMAVQIRSRSNTTTTGPLPAHSPPPSPPPMARTEFLLGHFDSLHERTESGQSAFGKPDAEKPRGSRRKDREEKYALPPIESIHSAEIPTPPSSAKAIPDATTVSQFQLFLDDYKIIRSPETALPESRASTRPSSPTPSSTADISGATILPSPRYLSGGFDAPPQFFREPVDPLFPSVGENLVIYFPCPNGQKAANSHFLEKVLGDFAASFTTQTPGVFRSSPHVSMMLNDPHEGQEAFLSPMTAQFRRARDSFHSTTSNGTAALSKRSSMGSHYVEPPLSSIPTVSATFEKSPADLQNELRAIMRHHFPPQASPSPTVTNSKAQFPAAAAAADDDDDEEEDLRWLTEGSEIDHIWRPILSSRGTNEDPAYSAIDLIVAIAAEEDGELDESRKGLELRRHLIEQIEQMPRKKGKGTCGGRVGLKYLLSNTLPQLRIQHPGTRDSAVIRGQFLLPELERYLSFNPQLRTLVIEFDFYTGSAAILELQRVLGPNVDVLKIACVADGVTQFASKSSKAPKAGNGRGGGIRIRTSLNSNTISYSLSPITPITPTGGRHTTTRKPVPAKGKQRPWGPKQRLISRADVVIPPFATVSSGIYIDAIQVLHAALMSREKMTGFYGGSKYNNNQVPTTPVVMERSRSESSLRKGLEVRQDTSYYLEEEETDEEDNQEGRRASFRRRVKNGSKALKWLGLE